MKQETKQATKPERKHKTKRETEPSLAGEQNMPKIPHREYDDLTDVEKTTMDLTKKMISLRKLRHGIKKSKWSEEEVRDHLDQLLDWCIENNLELSYPLVKLWFHLSDRQLIDWRVGENYSYLHEVMAEVNSIIEGVSLSKIDRYPVGNIFKLKAIHKYNDVHKVEIEQNSRVSVSTLRDNLLSMGIKPASDDDLESKE